MLLVQRYDSNIKAQIHFRSHQEKRDGKIYKEQQVKDLSKH